MATVAACTDKGAKRSVNQDACCVQVANTAFGEVVLAVVCDGVGGLSAGELASATVAYRFAQWFRQELPTLIAGMDEAKPFDFDSVQLVWGVLLTSLNEQIQAYGRTHAEKLGTTFSGLIACGGSYLVGHVGDCRVYQLTPRGVRQVTQDQTLLAKKLASGEITADEARTFTQRHVILQSVGTEGILKPAFYRGSYGEADLLVMCCDGAYRKVEQEGIESFFAGVDTTSEQALQDACRQIMRYDIQHGEKDNLTVVCVAASASQAVAAGAGLNHSEDGRGTSQAAADADLPTMVEPEEDDDDDLPTMVEPEEDDADLPTMVEPQEDEVAEEDLPTLVEGDDE